MTVQITTEAELDEWIDNMDRAWVLVTDAHGRPWIVYATEDNLYAVSFPMEGADEPLPQVTVGDMLTVFDGLELPITVAYDPEAREATA